MKPGITLALMLWLLLCAGYAQSHPLAPGLLALVEQTPEHFVATWKMPIRSTALEAPQPQLPAHCQSLGEINKTVAGSARLHNWQLHCPGGLVGATIGAAPLVAGDPGVMLRLQLLDGRHYHQMLGAQQPAFVVPEARSALQTAGSYLQLGVEHLLGGIDHLLFIICLYLLVGWNRQLLWTVTWFTLGHSTTLSLVAMGVIQFPVALVESLIALSIVITAAAWIRPQANSLLRRRPGLIAAAFGLLHGMGFAGALAAIGLPSDALPLALAAFNIGIELGQLAVIVVCYLAHRLLLRSHSAWPRWLQLAPGYAVGSLAALWFWQRLGVF